MDSVKEIVRDNILGRRSIRGGFVNRPLTELDLLTLVQAGVYAPSGSNTQAIRFVLITDPKEIVRIDTIRGNVGNARGLIAVFADRSVVDWTGRHNGAIWQKLAYQDSAAAIQNILLMATAMDIGSCWISAFLEMSGTSCLAGNNWQDVFDGYDLPESYEIMGIVMLGYLSDGIGDETHRGRSVDRQSVAHYIWSAP